MQWAMEMITHYGYLGIYALLALGVIGLPIPDEILMLFVGYLSSILVLNYSVSVLVSFSGAITGTMISYGLGNRLGQPLVDKHGKWVGLTTARFNKVKGWFARFGLWTILFGYFIPGVRHLTSYISGISAMPFKKYILVAGTSSFVWSVLFISIGYFVGGKIHFH